MKKEGGNKRFGIIYGFILTGFTIYAILDTFVIPHNYGSAVSSNRQSMIEQYQKNNDENHEIEKSTDSIEITECPAIEQGTQNNEEHSGVFQPQESFIRTSSDASVMDTYEDDNMSITLGQYRENDTDIYVADIQVSSPEYLKTALAKDTYGHNIKEKTSEIAAEHNAILAVDGDYYGVRHEGYVIREGVLYRETKSKGTEALAIMVDGSFQIVNQDDVSAQELLEQGAVNVISFGPGLVKNGLVCVDPDDEVAKSKESNPRAAIGVIDDLHYVFVVSDGRTEQSEGLSLYQLGTFMEKIGVINGYNLDGGGSATLFFKGNVINMPTSDGREFRERRVSDIVYIGY